MGRRWVRRTVAVIAAVALTVVGCTWAGARSGGASAAPNGGWRVFSVAGTAASASRSFGTPVPDSRFDRSGEAGVAYAAGEAPLWPRDIAVEADGSYVIASPGWGL